MRLQKTPAKLYVVRITSPDFTADVGADLFTSERRAQERFNQLVRANLTPNRVAVVMEEYTPSGVMLLGHHGVVESTPVGSSLHRRTHAH